MHSQKQIYFAASIRGGREDKELYLQIIGILSEYGIVLTGHIGDQTLSVWGEDGLSDLSIYERDMAWLAQAYVMVAEITTPSLGLGYEIGKMENKKPIICLFRKQNGRRISPMISGNQNILIKEYKELSDIKEILEKFFGAM